ncbi:hypothetical protein QOZ80_7AG0566420 [Eleusine coracana subsp. coracana]|nr:hypothetical protein QOZ80_7AG0566420 [Eleusine coracana subsp. coracana]
MTPPNKKLVLIALLVAFAAQPSAAIRAASAPAPGPVGAHHRLPTSSLLPPDFPCFSFLPRVLLQLCYAMIYPPMAVNECGSSLARMKPCAEFLTSNGSISTPSDKCCNGLESILDDGGIICLCRLAVGDVGSVLPTPLNMKRLFKIPRKCNSTVTLEAYTECSMDSVPPIFLPSPPPSDDDDYTD